MTDTAHAKNRPGNRLLEIRGKNGRWRIFDGDQQVGNDIYNSYNKAMVAANSLERKQNERKIPCLCCGQTFTSTGKAHRLCSRCKELYG